MAILDRRRFCISRALAKTANEESYQADLMESVEVLSEALKVIVDKSSATTEREICRMTLEKVWGSEAK